MYIYIYTYIHVYKYVYIYTVIYIYIYTYIYMYTILYIEEKHVFQICYIWSDQEATVIKGSKQLDDIFFVI